MVVVVVGEMIVVFLVPFAAFFAPPEMLSEVVVVDTDLQYGAKAWFRSGVYPGCVAVAVAAVLFVPFVCFRE